MSYKIEVWTFRLPQHRVGFLESDKIQGNTLYCHKSLNPSLPENKAFTVLTLEDEKRQLLIVNSDEEAEIYFKDRLIYESDLKS